MAPLAHVARPVEETVTSVVGPAASTEQAPQVAGIGVSVMGAWLQCPVAVNCTVDPFAVAEAGLTLSDCNCRGPAPSAHPAISAAVSHAIVSGNLFIASPSFKTRFR